MIWSLTANQTGEYTIDFDALDGDFMKIKLVDQTVDIGYRLMPGSYYMVSGRNVQSEWLPKRLRRSGGKQPMYDFVTARASCYICSNRFRQIVEELDPGLHQFEPVEIVDKKGNREEQDYFWLVPGVRLFALDPEKVDPPLRATGFYTTGTPSKDQKLFFRQEIVAQNNLFCTAEYIGLMFITDRLKDALEAAGITGTFNRRSFPLS